MTPGGGQWWRRLSRARGAAPEASAPSAPAERNPHYVLEPPSSRTQLDLFAGEWTSAVPTDDGGVSGPRADLFADPRIAWVIETLGPLEGWQVLELGPLEGGHTTMLERAGADVVAVEAHRRAFLRCLIVKNLLGLRARFELGDFVAYLRETDRRFDLCVACGVLYHLTNPLELIGLVAGRADRLALWTHYYDEQVNARRPDVAARFAGTRRLEANGLSAVGHVYEYREGIAQATFCGGARPTATWLTRHDLLGALEQVGLGAITVQFDDPDYPHGPSISLVAERRASSR